VNIVRHSMRTSRDVRQLMDHVVTIIPELVHEMALSYAEFLRDVEAKRIMRDFANHFSLPPSMVTLNQAREYAINPHTGENNPHSGGIHLADSLALHSFRELREQRNLDRFKALLGFRGDDYSYGHDLTPTLVGPLRRRPLEELHRNTGLLIPPDTPVEGGGVSCESEARRGYTFELS
jgi:hypothetical protein